MRSRYFFDKRDMKRGFAKYGIIFLISFIPLVLFNVFAYTYINIRWVIVLLDCIILLVFVVVGNHIAKKIFEKKDAKLAAKQKARDEMKKRKNQILEDSYKRIREEKKKIKEKQAEAVIEVEEIKDKEGIQKEEIKSTETKKTASPKKTAIATETKNATKTVTTTAKKRKNS